MKRIKLTVAYDGTGYSGWQIQPNAPTIENVLDEAICATTGEHIHVTGASRTDAGVHALGNVAVFDTKSTIPGERWAYAINRHLPEDVIVLESREVNPQFHPRHCNTIKTYEYTMLCGPHPLPQLRNTSWHVGSKLNVKAMEDAAQVLVGEHDFKSFCCVKTQVESTVRTVYSIEFEKKPCGPVAYRSGSDNAEAGEYYLVTMRIRGNGFLYNMVRIIAGTLAAVGKGRLAKVDLVRMLESKDRCEAGQTAPPQGLSLMNINYVDGDDRAFCG